MAKKPPVVKIVIPPSVPKAQKTKYAQYAKWAISKGVDKSVIPDVWYWSHNTPNVDPYLWTSVLLAESGANKSAGVNKSGQAVGIGQIATSWVGKKIPWDKAGRHFTADNNSQTGIFNYGVNLRMSATLWGYAVSKVGWENAYTDPTYGYNPHDPNKDAAWQKIQKTYSGRPAGNPPVTSPSAGPADTSVGSQVGQSTTIPFKDQFVAGIDKRNKFHFTNDPNRALQFNGAPLTRSSFLTLRDSLTSHYVSYTGKRPSNHQIQNFLLNGWSTYTLDVLLSKSKSFKNSPIRKQWKTNLEASVKNMLPKGGQIPDELLRQAIVNQWSAEAVADKLRKAPTYLQSNEFEGNVASMLNIHSSIMGNPDANAMIGIKDAALAGWSADQYGAWLRSQPGYTSSPEYQSKALGFLGALGLVTGAQPILAPNVGPGPGSTGPSIGNLPSDKRVKGTPTVAPVSDLGATLSRA